MNFPPAVRLVIAALPLTSPTVAFANFDGVRIVFSSNSGTNDPVSDSFGAFVAAADLSRGWEWLRREIPHGPVAAGMRTKPVRTRQAPRQKPWVTALRAFGGR